MPEPYSPSPPHHAAWCSLCGQRAGSTPLIVAADHGLVSAALCAVCAAKVAAPPGGSGPPGVDDTVAILSALRPGSEAHHDAAITDEALEAAARFSERYAGGGQVPNTAIDLIEEAAVRVRLRALEAAAHGGGRLRAALIAASAAKQAAVDAEAYEQAGEFKTQADALHARLAMTGAPTDVPVRDLPVVGVADVVAVVAARTGIPVAELAAGEPGRR
jgi:ATP-dependent Clp protease ATP-binding subunit ClpC